MNDINPITRGNAIIIVNGIMYPFVILVIGIRVYTRIRISKSFGSDDYLILAALVCFHYTLPLSI